MQKSINKNPFVRNLLIFLIVGSTLVIVGVLAFLLLRGLDLTPRTPLTGAEPPASFPAAKAEQQARLLEYGWQNREEGVARIPIQRAMELVAQQGMPTLSPYPTPVVTPGPAGGVVNQEGAQVFQVQGCGGCHGTADSNIAPTLNGIYGQMETLENGETITVDDAYLRQSILEPGIHVVQNYNPIMPSYQGRVTDAELNALISYIQSLGSQ